MPLPYTDIDYYVFTDAARYASQGLSPFLRDTYRYTPLLSWLLIPTSWDSHQLWFSMGKFIFMLCDLLTGYLSLLNLPNNCKYLSLIWFFNPMVITISTRGSSESLLTSFVLLTIHLLISSQSSKKYHWLKLASSGVVFGLVIHLKIYPFIYAIPFILFLDHEQPIYQPITKKRLVFAGASLISFSSVTYWMYLNYGVEYIHEAWLYHLIRIDHRHNFSVYNVLLYLVSWDSSKSLSLEKWAFIPQLALSVFIIPMTFKNGLKTKNLGTRGNILIRTLFVQTFIFIMYNKVCTSQYFIWFLCLLPQYIQTTTITRANGLCLLIGWVITQGFWLFNGWKLEFRGDLGVFTNGIFESSCLFFLWNTAIAYFLIDDVKRQISVIQSQELEKSL